MYFVFQQLRFDYSGIYVQHLFAATFTGHYLVGSCQFFICLGKLGINASAYQSGTNEYDDAPFHFFIHVVVLVVYLAIDFDGKYTRRFKTGKVNKSDRVIER